MEQAPLYNDIAKAPKGGKAHWRTCADGVRIRVATWKKGAKGTILVFPGRTEFIEKYGPAVQSILDLGYSAVVVDWRGQGLSDRLNSNPQLGHVGNFLDYQLDVDQVVQTISDEGLPAPTALIAHSMGGAIGLRALHNGLPVSKVVFSAPMWGIHISPALIIPAKLISTLGPYLGFANKFSPNTSPENYVQANPFDGNSLTNDRATYDWLTSQLDAYPKLGIGGPSIKWLQQALSECRKLRGAPPPQTDCLCFLGSQETIVSTPAINKIMSKWKNGRLINVDNAQHEILMEVPEIVENAWTEIESHLTV